MSLLWYLSTLVRNLIACFFAIVGTYVWHIYSIHIVPDTTNPTHLKYPFWLSGYYDNALEKWFWSNGATISTQSSLWASSQPSRQISLNSVIIYWTANDGLHDDVDGSNYMDEGRALCEVGKRYFVHSYPDSIVHGAHMVVWNINHCLGLSHETMACAVCLSIFLWGLAGFCRPRWAPCWPHEPCYQGMTAYPMKYSHVFVVVVQ